MSQITGLNQILVGNTPDANIHRQNFQLIQERYNFHDKNKTLVHGVESNDEITNINYFTNIIKTQTPIGSVEAIWDSEDASVPVLDTDYWQIMDGTTINDEDSFFNGVTIPDMTETFFVEDSNCSDILGDSLDYSISDTAVQHSHSLSHVHDINAHTHSFSNHTGHLSDDDWSAAKIGVNSYGNLCFAELNYGASSFTGTAFTGCDPDSSGVSSPARLYFRASDGSYPNYDIIDFDTAGTSGETSLSTSITNINYSSIVSSLKPYCVKVRYYLRYK